jgi:hypothetical protein
MAEFAEFALIGIAKGVLFIVAVVVACNVLILAIF